jgi:hypothetical protein
MPVQTEIVSEPEADDPTLTLALYDRLALAVGRVALADVELERSLRTLAVIISLGGVLDRRSDQIAWEIPRDATQLIEYCERWLPSRVQDARVVEAGTAALSSAQFAHDERNRVVHDQWVPKTVDGVVVPGSFVTHRFAKNRALPVSVTARTIEDVYSVEVALHQCAVQTDKLAYTITLSDARRPDWTARMAAGEFDDPLNPGIRIIPE